MLVAFALHHFRARLRDVLAALSTAAAPTMEARRVCRPSAGRCEPRFTACAINITERDRRRSLVPEHHAAGVRNAENVDADAVRDDRGLVVDRELDDGLPFFFSISIGMVTSAGSASAMAISLG